MSSPTRLFEHYYNSCQLNKVFCTQKGQNISSTLLYERDQLCVSNDTIQLRKCDIAEDIEQQVESELRCAPTLYDVIINYWEVLKKMYLHQEGLKSKKPPSELKQPLTV